MFDQIRQAMQMRKEAKRIQSEIEKITFVYENGGIKCQARGDMTIQSIQFSPDAFAEVLAGKPERYNTMLLNVVNAALKGVKKETQESMMKMMQGSPNGLSDLFGGGK